MPRATRVYEYPPGVAHILPPTLWPDPFEHLLKMPPSTQHTQHKAATAPPTPAEDAPNPPTGRRKGKKDPIATAISEGLRVLARSMENSATEITTELKKVNHTLSKMDERLSSMNNELLRITDGIDDLNTGFHASQVFAEATFHNKVAYDMNVKVKASHQRFWAFRSLINNEFIPGFPKDIPSLVALTPEGIEEILEALDLNIDAKEDEKRKLLWATIGAGPQIATGL